MLCMEDHKQVLSQLAALGRLLSSGRDLGALTAALSAVSYSGMTTIVALAGDFIASGDKLDHYITKIGGRPWFPGTHQPSFAQQDVACPSCSTSMSLVLQAHAPLTPVECGTSLQERCLYLFACMQPACAAKTCSWRVFRCQQSAAASENQADAGATSAAAAVTSTSTAALTTATAADTFFGAAGYSDDGGFGDTGDWGDASFSCDPADPLVGGTTGSAFAFHDLNAALDSSTVQKASSTSKQQAKARAAAAEQAGAAAAAVLPSMPGPSSGAQLPEYHLFALAEADAFQQHGGNSSRAKDEQHVQELMRQYQQQLEAGSSGQGNAGAEPDTESYAPEEYEKDSIRGVDPAYVKFHKRLQKVPEQCARYRFGGQLLWPNSSKPRVAACAGCGAERAVELQLMPALIQLTLEAYAELGEEERQRALGSQDGVAAWEWSTVAVFTCSRSCGGSGDGSKQGPEAARAAAAGGSVLWAEEVVVAVNEDECHDLSVFVRQQQSVR